MLDRFSLGKLISFEQTFKGVGKQTMFVTSSSGEYVLKGNPLYKGQFIEEKYFVENLHSRTKLPVPAPYLIDESEDIFGWNYSIMPRLSGRHISELEIEFLGDEEKKQIAELFAKTLIEVHNWSSDIYGEFDPNNQSVRPFEGSYKTWLYNRVRRYWLEDAKKYSKITLADTEWVENLLLASEEVFDGLNSPTFVMGDFKLDNMLLQRMNNGWHLSGIFDFTTGYFGDAIADLPKMIAMYLDKGEEELAKQFITVYFNLTDEKENLIERFNVYMLHQRVLDWGCAYAINRVTWDRDLSFSKWAERFTEFAKFLL